MYTPLAAILFATVALIASARGHAAPAAEAVLNAIDTCLERLDPQVDVGYERIAARCPDLPKRLQQSTLSTWLPKSWQDSGNNLSAGSLEELRVLATRELAVQSTGQAPSVKRLHNVLTEIGQAVQTRPGLWSRFKVWLRRVLADREAHEDAGWFTRTISRVGIPQTVIELVTYLSLAAVIGLAILIVVNEVRAADALWRAQPRSAKRPAAIDDLWKSTLTWQSVERAPLSEKPGALFELIIDRLMRAQLLPPARSLTNREVTRAAKLSTDDDRRRLESLALTAEQVRYFPQPLSQEHLNAAIDSGRALLERLESGAK